MLADAIPHLPRTDKKANVIQTFFTDEEKQAIADASKSLGVPMGHLIRVAILQWLESQKKKST
jgi:hypothetical protein